MIAFLKTCLKGLIVIITSPLWAAFFVLAAVYALILFFCMAITNLLRVITRKGGGIYNTSYDKKAKEILSNPGFNPMTGSAQPAYPPMGYQGPANQFQGQYYPPAGGYPPPQYDPRQIQNREEENKQ